MKALLISDDQNFLDIIELFLKNKGFDIIKYRWLIKALDNIEEIKPDCIVVSASEYPRHWKTLVQFASSSIGAEKTAVVLYNSTPMNDDDIAKVDLLGITAVFSSLEQNELDYVSSQLDEFFGLKSETLPEPAEIEAANEDIYEDEEIISVSDIKEKDSNILAGTGYYILNNPDNNKLITGTYFGYAGHKLTINLSDDINFSNQEITYFSYYFKDQCISCKARVSEELTLNQNKMLVLELQDTYGIIQ